MALSLGQAAIAVGMSKPTLQRAIKNGRLSASRNEDGSYNIDKSELAGVYPDQWRNRYVTGTLKQDETPSNPDVLQAEIEGLRQQLALLRDERDDLRRRLDDEAEEGSVRGASLSLLLDHCLLLHPKQTACLEHRQPAHTVGSLIHHTKVESLVQVIRDVVAADDPPARLQQLAETLHELYPALASSKHMIGRDLGRLEPTPSLRYRATG